MLCAVGVSLLNLMQTKSECFFFWFFFSPPQKFAAVWWLPHVIAVPGNAVHQCPGLGQALLCPPCTEIGAAGRYEFPSQMVFMAWNMKINTLVIFNPPFMLCTCITDMSEV